MTRGGEGWRIGSWRLARRRKSQLLARPSARHWPHRVKGEEAAVMLPLNLGLQHRYVVHKIALLLICLRGRPVTRPTCVAYSCVPVNHTAHRPVLNALHRGNPRIKITLIVIHSRTGDRLETRGCFLILKTLWLAKRPLETILETHCCSLEHSEDFLRSEVQHPFSIPSSTHPRRSIHTWMVKWDAVIRPHTVETTVQRVPPIGHGVAGW